MKNTTLSKLGGVLVSLAILSCGNPADVTYVEPTQPAAYEGTWLVDGMTHTVDGYKGTWVRDGDVRAVRGDVVVNTISDESTLTLRWTLLHDNLMVRDVTEVTYDFTIDHQLWILTGRTSALTWTPELTHVDPYPIRHVYEVREHTDGLSLTWISDDARNLGPAPPTAISLTPADDWMHATVGTWNAVGECVPNGRTHEVTTSTLNINPHHNYEWRESTQYYLDDSCEIRIIDAVIARGWTGYTEEVGATLRLWTHVDDGNTYIVTPNRYAEYALQTTSAEMEWGLKTCEPKETCRDDVPNRMLWERVTDHVATP